MDRAEDILAVPEREQLRLALVYIGKMLEQVNRHLDRIASMLEGTLAVEVYRGDKPEGEGA